MPSVNAPKTQVEDPTPSNLPPEQKKMVTPYGLSLPQREVQPTPSKTSKAIRLSSGCGKAGAAGEEGEVINVEPPLCDQLVAQGGATFV